MTSFSHFIQPLADDFTLGHLVPRSQSSALSESPVHSSLISGAVQLQVKMAAVPAWSGIHILYAHSPLLPVAVATALLTGHYQEVLFEPPSHLWKNRRSCSQDSQLHVKIEGLVSF